MTEPFGIVLSAFGGDLPFAKGCCASLREHLPGVPICVIVDGHLPASEFRRVYGATVITRSDVDARLRGSFGYGLTKMVAFWHSPFERFLYVDADTVCWGDPLQGLDASADFVFNAPHEVITDEIQSTQYFHPDRLFEHVAEFPWRGRPYFNTGCFVARRGIFGFDEYLDLIDIQRRHPGTLFCGDQGILNVLVFAKESRGELTTAARPLQAIVPVIEPSELRRRFALRSGGPAVQPTDRRVIHWAGAKPFLTGGSPFTAPMTHYRRRHRRNAGHALSWCDPAVLLAEEGAARLFGRSRSRFRALAAQSSRLWRRVAAVRRPLEDGSVLSKVGR